jgi:hypothetical protein
MKNSKVYLNQAELENKMLNFNKEVSFSGVTFANVIYKNDYSKSKTVKGVKQLQKITEQRITLGADYTSKVRRIEVNKQGAESSEFQAMEMKGKSYTNGIENPVVHADKNPDFKMLVMIVENGVKSSTTYLHNGEVVTMKQAEEMDLLTDAHYNNSTYSTAGRGVINEENNFKFNTLGFDKILQITINKVDYIIIK